MGDVDDREGRQVARDILTELVFGCIPGIQHEQASDEDVLARLYLLRDTAAGATGLGAEGAATAEWINQAAMVMRDETDREQALALLRYAAAHLAAIGAADRRAG
jgi:hypothetical protein